MITDKNNQAELLKSNGIDSKLLRDAKCHYIELDNDYTFANFRGKIVLM